MIYSKKIPVILCLLNSFVQSAHTESNITQQTKGDCSPAIIAQGNVSVKCGISKKLLERIKNETDKNSKQDIKLEYLIKTVQDLHELLSKSDDKFFKQAQAKLDEGNFEGAETLLKQSSQKHGEGAEKQQKAQVAEAYALAKINVLKLNYPEAKTYYQQAVCS